MGRDVEIKTHRYSTSAYGQALPCQFSGCGFTNPPDNAGVWVHKYGLLVYIFCEFCETQSSSFLSRGAYRHPIRADIHFVKIPFRAQGTSKLLLQYFLYSLLRNSLCEKVKKQHFKHVHNLYNILTVLYLEKCGLNLVVRNPMGYNWPKFDQNH